MYLSEEERGMLAGEQGEGASFAMQLLVTVGEADIVADEFPVDLFYVELRVRWGESSGSPRQARFSTLRAAVPQRDG